MNYPLSKVIAPQPDPLYPGKYLLPVDYTVQLPTSVDFRKIAPAVEDQGSVGDCTANAQCGCLEFFSIAAGKPTLFSELFNYWTSRYILAGNTAPTSDDGSTNECALQAVTVYGVCTEATWPITESPDVQPSQAAYAEALNYQTDTYYQIGGASSTWFDLERLCFAVCYALAKGYPVIVSGPVGQTIYDLAAGQVYQAVNQTTNPSIGGHAWLVVGFTGTFANGTLTYICRNSWGVNWCDNGYFLMSPQALSDSYEHWVVEGFMGQTTVGPDTTEALPVPTAASTIAYCVTYVFRTKFGRIATNVDAQFWAASMGNWLVQQIIAGASPNDQAYLSAHPVTLPPLFDAAQTVTDVLTIIFMDYFGRAPLAAGAEFWANAILNYLTRQIVAAASVSDKAFMDTFNII